jgi:hypothetical protein
MVNIKFNDENNLRIFERQISEGIPRQAEVALGVPVRLRPRIFSAFSTTRVVDRQPNAPANFTPGEIPGTHFQRLIRPHGTWFCWKEPRNKSQVTQPGIDLGTVRLVTHYATPGPLEKQILRKMSGPVNIDNIWRIRNNVEIDKLIEVADIVRFIKV